MKYLVITAGFYLITPGCIWVKTPNYSDDSENVEMSWKEKAS